MPETLIPAVKELRAAYRKFVKDPEFSVRLEELLSDYVGRPTPLYFARHLTRELGAMIRSNIRGNSTMMDWHKMIQ